MAILYVPVAFDVLPIAMALTPVAVVAPLPIIMASVPLRLSFSQILPPLTYKRLPNVSELGSSVVPFPSGLKKTVRLT